MLRYSVGNSNPVHDNIGKFWAAESSDNKANVLL